MPSSKVIGGPFDKDVLNQLNVRSTIYSKKENRADQNLQYLNSKTGWVKLTSSVNAGGSSELANKYVFIGGTKGRFGENTYSNFTGEGLGFRPMPGITGVQIRAINRFGVLKEATITFNCWDISQLQELELLYMRPGFSALLEWGHSIYYRDIDNLITTPSTVSSMFTEGTTKEDLYREIDKLKKSSGYNYDGIFGFIKNFSWKYRQDGGYDCTTTLISIGEVIESLTVDVGSSTFPNSKIDPNGEIKPTMLEEVFNTIIKTSEAEGVSEVWNTLTEKYKDFTDTFTKINGVSGLSIVSKKVETKTPVDAESSTKSPNKFVYMKLDSFCALINTILPKDEKSQKPLIRLNTKIAKIGEDSDIPLCRYRTYDYHVSSDPAICLLLPLSTAKWASGQVLPSVISSLRKSLNSTSSDEILNIWVNITLLGEAITSLVSNPDKSSRTLINLFNNILPKINIAIGGDYNELALHYEEDKFTYYIVDRKIKAAESEEETPILNVTGLRSTVTNFDFTTKLSPTLSTMVAVSAQNNGSDVGVEAEALFRWNEGLTDRILGNKFINQTQDTSKKESVEEERKKQQSKRFNNIFAALKEFYGGIYDPIKFEKAKVEYADFTRTYIQTYTEESAGTSAKAGPAGIVPFEVNIDMEGISGIKIGQAFRINRGIMPGKYDEVLGFIVTGVEHTIASNRWDTKLKAQTIVLKPGSKSTESPNFNQGQSSTGTSTTERQGVNSAPIKGSPLLRTVLENAGYKPGTFEYEFALVIGTKEGWLPNINGGKGSRSYRNNNPGNLDYSNGLKSIDPKVTIEPGGRFARFSTAELGAKALVEKKIKKWGRGDMPVTAGNQNLIPAKQKYKAGTPPTVEQFMYTYAPPNENNTEGYIGSVVSSLQKNYPKVTRFTKLKEYLT